MMLFCVFHHVEIYTDNAKAMVDKITGALAQTKAVAPNYANSHYILSYSAFAIRTNFSIKNVFDEAVKIIN